MKLKDLKNWINSLPEEELDSNLMYYGQDYDISGSVETITKQEVNLYSNNEDDPDLLLSETELIIEGWIKEDIDLLTVMIAKNDYIINI